MVRTNNYIVSTKAMSYELRALLVAQGSKLSRTLCQLPICQLSTFFLAISSALVVV